jgi:hypothetical protein
VLDCRKFIVEKSELDDIISFQMKLFIWQNQIKGLRTTLKKRCIITVENINDKKFNEKKFNEK